MKKNMNLIWYVLASIVVVALFVRYFNERSDFENASRRAENERDAPYDDSASVRHRAIADSIFKADVAAAKAKQDSIDNSPYGKAERKRRLEENKKYEARMAKIQKVADKLDCSISDAERLLDHEVWIGMTYEMVLYMRGQPDAVNLANYGNGDQYQACWEGHTPFCFYFRASDHIVYAYN